MLEAYVDDTGKHGGVIYGLAGLIATEVVWRDVAAEWEVLCRVNPKTPDFHMAEAERLDGTYWGHADDPTIPFDELARRRDRRVNQLAEMLASFAMHLIWVHLTHDDYKAIVANNVHKHIDDPYFFLFWHMQFAVIKDRGNLPDKGKVRFVFDEQGKVGRRAAKWYDDVIVGIPEAKNVLADPPEFAHDSNVLPLKAADFVAWHMQRDVNDANKPNPPGRRPATQHLLSLPRTGSRLDAQTLSALMAEFKKHGL